jgi:hypothetical protein
MNTDTLRSVNNIKRDGWYHSSLTLGEGGWQAVRQLGNFNCYALFFDEGETETIYAKDDETAITAFKLMYHLGMGNPIIAEKIVYFRTIFPEKE